MRTTRGMGRAVWGVAASLVWTGFAADAPKPDDSKLQLKGNGHRQDSFALAVQAAAKLFGQDTDYDALTCLAGNAFAPFRDLDEDCTSHCQLEARFSDRAMATVAAYAGLRARRLALPPFEGDEGKAEDQERYLRPAATTIRTAMDAGEVVIALAAMDAWIRHMREVKGYCAPCYGRGQNSWHDAQENAERLVRGARVAAKRLRSLGPAYAGVAGRYDRIADLMAPALSGKGGEHYSKFIGDLAKQKAHADTALAAVRAELAAAADDMEKALPAPASR